MVEEDLRTKLVNDTTLEALFTAQGVDPTDVGAVAYNRTPEVAPNTRIWFVRAETVNDDLLTGGRIIEHAIYDLECISPDLSTSMQFARAIQDLFNPFRGAMTDTFVQGCDVTDQSDDYIYHQDFSDRGLAAAALRMELII